MNYKLELTDKKLCANSICPISLENISAISESRLSLMSDNQCYRTDAIHNHVKRLYERGLRVGDGEFVLPTRSPISNEDLLKLNIPNVQYRTRNCNC